MKNLLVYQLRWHIISEMTEDYPDCSVCGKKAKQRKLFLPALLKGYREEACICEKCFFRLPADLHKQLISNASNQTGDIFNDAIIKALIELDQQTRLNKGYTLFLLNTSICRFEKFLSEIKMKRASMEYKKQHIHIIKGFKNGHTIFSIDNS